MLASLLVASSCRRYCDASLRVGEIVQIPIQFNGFSPAQINNNILVYRVDKLDPSLIDTFNLSSILWDASAQSTARIITDKASGTLKQYGTYESFFHNCSLILDWQSGRDTLANIEILKSKENITGCYKNDPNVRIDNLAFMHKGMLIGKNQTIQINK